MTIPSVLTGLLLLAGLIVMNGLFVAAEYALVSLRKSRVEEMVKSGRPGAQTVLQLKDNLDRSIAGSQLGITFASLAVGWLGGEALEGLVKLLLGFVPNFGFLTPSAATFVVSFVLLSMTQVIVGEQIPKQIALRLPEQTIVRLSKPFRAFLWLMSPLVWLMDLTAKTALRLLGIASVQAEEHPLPSAGEFQILIEESGKAGNLGQQESDLLLRALDLKQLTVRDVMVPRRRMDSIPDSLSLPEVLAVVCKTKHSKLPVYRAGEGIIGILYTRDLFDIWSKAQPPGTGVAPNTVSQPPAPFKLSACVRKAHFAPESMLAATLLQELKTKRLQMAIVVDEFGTAVGLITLEDLVEQLVGDIWDEFDTPNAGIESTGENTWRVQGEVTLFEFNKALAAEVGCSVHCTTVAGAVIDALDHHPSIGEKVTIAGFTFTVQEMRGAAIYRLDVKREPQVPLVAPDSAPPSESTSAT
jgi:CBS domain containing-hemolysin-like protein